MPIISVNENLMTRKCSNCEHEHAFDVTGVTVPFITEFNEYQNYRVDCPSCGAMEFFNMNMPNPLAPRQYAVNDPEDNVYLMMFKVRADLRGE